MVGKTIPKGKSGMSRLLMLVALFGFCFGCAPADDAATAPATTTEEPADDGAALGSDTSTGSDTSGEGEGEGESEG